MNNDNNTITSTQWMHCCYIQKPDFAILSVAEKVVTINKDTNEVISAIPRIKNFINPKRRVWITKEEYRRHKYKKESELVEHCDVFEVEDCKLIPFLKEKTGVSKFKWAGKKSLCNSPYIYGTDISMEALSRFRYEKNQKHPVAPFTVGALDIETDVTCDASDMYDRPSICITVICDKNIYTVALESFMWKYTDSEYKQKVRAEVSDVIDCAMKEFGSDITDNGFTIYPKIVKTEKELYDYIFSAIEKEKTDYIFIWNIGFDIPQILERITRLGLDPRDYICSRDINKNLRGYEYIEDKKKVPHVVQKWNWFKCTGYTQYLDAMTIYGQMNKHKPKRSKYDLSSIMSEVLGKKKLEFSKSHKWMQEHEFVYYWAYNIYDAILVQLGNWATRNYQNLYNLTEHSDLNDFSKQTVMLCNDYHHYLLENGQVLASTGENMEGPYDHLMSKSGGAVLDARNTYDIGIPCVAEFPTLNTNVLPYCADNDYEALYPSVKIACGIAKRNKRSTILAIEGKPQSVLEDFCVGIASPKENAVWLGEQFFNLPGYEEMEALVDEELKSTERK